MPTKIAWLATFIKPREAFLIDVPIMPVKTTAKIKNKIERTPKIPTVLSQLITAEAPLVNTVCQKIVWLIPTGL